MSSSKKPKILICLCGLSGAIGTTIVAGAKSKDDEFGTYGLVTESPLIQQLGIDFPSIKDFMFIGWDIKKESVLNSILNHGICSAELINKTELSQLLPRTGITSSGISINNWVKQETSFIRDLCIEKNISRIFVVNLLPTEGNSYQLSDENIEWNNLKSIKFDATGITLSRIYLRLAIEIGAHFINFTPNIAETPKLKKLAKERGILLAGRDGKTGQTFLKTLIAPAFRDRNLRIDGWFSTNILGNNDGKSLNDPDAFLTKQKSKIESLSAILGYSPGGKFAKDSHHVHIHYYPPRGDAKESWDNIDFSGFLGSPMQMKINWLGKDSILAAPLVLDLVRIMTIVAESNYKGILSEVGYFFKSPLTPKGTIPIHDVFQQFQILLRFLEQFKESIGKEHKSTRTFEVNNVIKSLPLSTSLQFHVGLAGNTLNSENTEHKKRKIVNDFNKRQKNIYYLDLIFNQLKFSLGSTIVNLYASILSTNFLDLLLPQLSYQNVFLVAEQDGGNPLIIQWAQDYGLKVRYIPFVQNSLLIDWTMLQKECQHSPPGCIYIDWPYQFTTYNFASFSKITDCPLIYNISYCFKNIVGGGNQDFLDEFDLLIFDSHIPFPGTKTSIAMVKNEELDIILKETTKRNMLIDEMHLFTLAISLIEFAELSEKFVKQHKTNISTFAEVLSSYISDHIEISTFPLSLSIGSEKVTKKNILQLIDAGIFVEAIQLPGEKLWGILISLENATLLGLDESSSRDVAQLIKKIIKGNISSDYAKRELNNLLNELKPMFKTSRFIKSLIEYSNTIKNGNL